MAILPVCTIPNPVLKKISFDIKRITPAVIQIARDMIDTMRHYPHCVGIAAPQVGKNLKLIIIDVSLNHRPHPNHGLISIINPRIADVKGIQSGREGCLSVPDFTGNVSRAETIIVDGIDPFTSKNISIKTNGFESVVLQHEIDHLHGILFLDRVSSLKTDIFRRKQK